MTTTMIIIISLAIGSTVGCVLAMFLFSCFHNQQREDWQAEYRRLTGLIADAMIALKKPGLLNSKAYGFLDRAYNGEK